MPEAVHFVNIFQVEPAYGPAAKLLRGEMLFYHLISFAL